LQSSGDEGYFCITQLKLNKEILYKSDYFTFLLKKWNNKRPLPMKLIKEIWLGSKKRKYVTNRRRHPFAE
jgi:hypothetical protein